MLITTFSNLGVDGAFELEDLDSEDNKNYYIVFDRNGNYTDLVIFDEEGIIKDYSQDMLSINNYNVRILDLQNNVEEKRIPIWENSKNDFLFVMFGHNDEKAEQSRYTNANGSKEDKGTFKNVLYTRA